MTAGSLRVLNPGNVWGAETELNRDGFYPSLHTPLKPVTRVNYLPERDADKTRSSSASTSASASAASRPWTTSTSPSAAPRSRA